jgi:RHS repeat-associated protein
MRAWKKAVSSRAFRIGFALILMTLLGLFSRQATSRADPVQWDPVLLDAPRPAPYPLGFGPSNEFRRSLIQLSDGGLRLAFLDLCLPSGSEPLTIKRLYRSGLQTTGVFGKGWASNLDMRLARTGDGVLRIVESDGRATGYEEGTNGHFSAINGTFPASELIHANGQWIRSWVDGSREIFDDRGRLVERGNGQDRLTLSYESAETALPESIADSANHVLRLRYRNGLLVEAAFPDQRVIRYDYDDRALSEVTDAIGRNTRFAYRDGRMTRMELPLGTVMEFNYEPGGNLREAAGPEDLKTRFAWSFDPKRSAIKMTASPAASNLAVEIKPEAVDLNQWDVTDKTSRPALQMIHTLAGGKVLSAHLLGDKILLEGPDGRAVLDPQTARNDETETTGDGLDPHEWRLRFTPGMARSRDSDATYDAAGRPVSVAIDERTSESWKWDQADRIVAWTDAGGTTSQYAYDALDRPVRITVGGELFATADYNWRGLLARSFNADGEVSYDYDDAGNLRRIAVKDGRVIDVRRDSAGQLVALEIDGKPSLNAAYDEAGRLATFSAPDGTGFRYTYDKRGELKEMLDPGGATTSYDLANESRLASTSYPDGTKLVRRTSADRDQVEITTANGDKSAITYDAAGRIAEAQAPGLPKFIFKYGKDGKLDSAESSDGGTRRFEYDEAGRLVHESGEAGTSIRFAYDDQGRLKSYEADDDQAAFTYGPDGSLAIATDQKGLTGRLRFDAEGDVVEHLYSDRTAWRFGYEKDMAQSVSPAGGVLTQKFDADGRVVEVEYDSEGVVTRRRYRYDKSGRAAEARYEDGTFTQFKYDAAGNLANMRDRLGNDHKYRFSERGSIAAIEGPLGTERWTYDSEGRLIAHEDPTEAPTRFEYGEDGKSITTIDPDGRRTQVWVNETGQTEKIQDAAGGVIRREYNQFELPSAFIDPNSNKTTWSYDDKNRAIERRTPLGKVYRLSYDERGNLVESASPGNRMVKRRYDPHGRLSAVETSDGTSWMFGYDDAGELAAVEGPSGRVAYERDSLGRVTALSDGGGTSVSASYDAVGRIEQIVAPKGNKIAYAYNSLGQLAKTTTKAGSIKYAYDKAGRIARIDYPNGTRTSYRYLSGFRIGSIATTGSKGDLLLEEAYEYDRRGNVTAIVRKGSAIKGAERASAALLGRSEFGYDALNRIVSAQFADGTQESFAFDPAGNLTKQLTESATADGGKTITDESLHYDADQALIQINERVYSPDPNGSFCADDAGCADSYDAFNRLRKWRDQSYSYDSEGRLAGWRDGRGNGGHFVHLEGQLVAEMGMGDRPNRYYVTAPNDQLWAAVRIADRDYYPIRSANGSLLAVTDEKGRIAGLCSYHTFKTGPSWAGTDSTPACEYAGGRELGPGTWFGTRVFSGQGARFFSRDSLGPDKDGNFYAYALGNPLRFIDRTGTNATPAYWQMLEQLGVEASPDGVRDLLVKQFKGEAITNPDPKLRKEAQVLATVLTADAETGASTIPIRDLGRLKDGGLGSYFPEKGDMALDLRKLAETANDPQDFVQRLKGAVAHEAGGHGLGFRDVKPWSQGVARPYSQLHEVSAFVNQSRFDKTIAGMNPQGASQTDQQRLQWIVDHVAGKEARGPDGKILTNPDGTVKWEIKPVYPAEMVAEDNKKILRKSGEKEFFTHTIEPPEPVDGKYAPGNKPFTQKVDALKQLRLEQAAESAGRTPIAAAGRSGAATEGTVSRALSRQSAALEKAAAARDAVTRTVRNALSYLKSKAHAAFGKATSTAKRAFAYIAKKFGALGRFAKYAAPVVGQIAAVKDAIDTAISLGQAAGQLAFDIYDAYRKGRDAILNPLDKLIKEMEALDDKLDPKRKKKKARQAELQASLSPEPAQLGMPSIGAAQPGAQPSTSGSTSGQPQPEANTAPDSGQPSESAEPEQPLGPTTPLGGLDNQPGPGPKPPGTPQAKNPETEKPKPPQPKAKPDAPKPNAPDQQASAKPDAGQEAASGRPAKEWDAMCGGSMEAVVSAMQNSTSPPPVALIPTCLCFYFLKKEVPGLSPEAIVDPPPQRQACGAYILALKDKKPQEVVKAEPPPEKGSEPKKETAEAKPEESPAPPAPEPAETPKEQAEAPAPPEDGLPPPAVPESLNPQAQKPEPAPEPKPAPPVYEPERPSSTELEKPDLYNKGPKVTSSAMTPKETSTPKADGGSAGGGSLDRAYRWAAGWLGYVSGKIQ